MKYSQNNEQDIILEYFLNRQGKFLDIGAYDGVTFSNTKALSELGWGGVLIEPSPTNFVGLMRNVSGENNILVNAAIALQGGIVEFYDSNGDAISTTEKSHMKKWSEYTSFKKIYVNTVTIEDVINNFGNAFEFINIDVEGTSVNIFNSIANKFQFSMVCVEHDNKISECEQIAQRIGMKKVLLNAENIIFTR